LKLSARFGPQIVTDMTHFGIRSRKGLEVSSSRIKTAGQAIATLLGVYYLMDLSYPAAYGQALGVFQEILLKTKFEEKSKVAAKFIEKYDL